MYSIISSGLRNDEFSISLESTKTPTKYLLTRIDSVAYVKLCQSCLHLLQNFNVAERPDHLDRTYDDMIEIRVDRRRDEDKEYVIDTLSY